MMIKVKKRIPALIGIIIVSCVMLLSACGKSTGPINNSNTNTSRNLDLYKDVPYVENNPKNKPFLDSSLVKKDFNFYDSKGRIVSVQPYLKQLPGYDEAVKEGQNVSANNFVDLCATGLKDPTFMPYTFWFGIEGTRVENGPELIDVNHIPNSALSYHFRDGVHIGSKRSDVRNAYGTNYESKNYSDTYFYFFTQPNKKKLYCATIDFMYDESPTSDSNDPKVVEITMFMDEWGDLPIYL